MKTCVIILLAITAFSAVADSTFVCGSVSGVWDTTGSPYCVVCDVHVETGDTLRIMPGVEVIFMSSFGFYVDSMAVLKAIGTASDSIIFTAQDTVLTDSTGGHHGIRFTYAADACSLAYCRIEYGNATDGIDSLYTDDDYGGGISCNYNSSPTITNNTITGNSAIRGGGISCERHSSPTITNNTISGNSVSYWGGGYGGGIFCDNSSPTITNNTITGNSADNSGGGGIFCWYYSSPTITNNTITGNSAGYGGGGIFCWNYSSPSITNNTISGNSAGSGGGIFCRANSSPTITNNTVTGNSAGSGGGIFCWYYSSPTITNNTITGNSADDGYGGGIYCYYSNPTITNNTVTGNSASYGGGISCYYNSSPTITNNILWDNTASSGNEIYVDYYESGGTHYPCTLFVAYTDVDTAECHVETGSAIIWGDGNINVNPFFVDDDTVGGLDLHLTDSSSCIDAGAESVYVPAPWDTVIYAPITDIEGNPRPRGSGWDMGAYEYGGGIIGETRQKPETMELSAHPNPFNSSVSISLVGATGRSPLPATVKIFDINGRLVYAPSPSVPLPGGEGGNSFSHWEKVAEGRMRGFIWQPDETIGSGVYLVRAKIGDKSLTKRIVYLK